LNILKFMVQYQATLDSTFSALSDPTRRAVLERLGSGPATIGELTEPFGMSLTGLKREWETRLGHELRFERVFDAASGEVFDALIDPEGMEKVYGLDEAGWIVESRGEVCVGGTWSAAFGPSWGELYRFVHAFGMVGRMRRIACASGQGARGVTRVETDVEIALEERDGKALMETDAVTHMRYRVVG
jgi:DNA-binding transcriptional ArsR family regulator